MGQIRGQLSDIGLIVSAMSSENPVDVLPNDK
jgi:hypothetical protein